MAEIRRYPFISHARSATTDHLVHIRGGRTRHSGSGQAFWFRPLSAALSEVPIDDRELSLLFHARTSDYQDVAVQATVAYRIQNPDVAVQRLDFGLNAATGQWRSRPLDQIGQMLTELAQQHALDLLARLPLAEAMATGLTLVRERMSAGLRDDDRLHITGIEVIDIRVVALVPESDLERAISENELQSKIELAVREERLVAQRGANDRRRATETIAAQRIETEGKADQSRLLAQARADTTRLVGAAEAESEAARMAVYASLDPSVLLGLAAREAAGNLPQIGTLTLSPDVVSSALAHLAGGER